MAGSSAERIHDRLILVGIALLGATLSPPAQAQRLGDTVEQHVKSGLDKPKKKRKKKRSRKKKRKRSSRRSPQRQTHQAPRRASNPPPVKSPGPTGPSLPRRVFGSHFRLDPGAGVAYRGWRPQGYPNLETTTESYYTYSLQMSAVLFKLIKLHRGYYESNALGGPNRPGVSIAARVGGVAPKLTKVVGMLGFGDLRWLLEPMVRYETRAYRTTLTPTGPVRVIPHDASPDDDLSLFPETTRSLSMVSGFETLVIGAIYNHDHDPGFIVAEPGSIPPIYAGIGFTSFHKPYQVRVGGDVLEGIVFDARFRGAGLALGADSRRTPDSFYGSFSGQVGIGDVELLDDYSLNDALPSTWLIGYGQAELTFGYLHALMATMPTPLVGVEAQAGGSTFFYVKTVDRDEDEETPALNWDLLWGVRAYLQLPL